jgi:hypothetical protein
LTGTRHGRPQSRPPELLELDAPELEPLEPLDDPEPLLDEPAPLEDPEPLDVPLDPPLDPPEELEAPEPLEPLDPLELLDPPEPLELLLPSLPPSSPESDADPLLQAQHTKRIRTPDAFARIAPPPLIELPQPAGQQPRGRTAQETYNLCACAQHRRANLRHTRDSAIVHEAARKGAWEAACLAIVRWMVRALRLPRAMPLPLLMCVACGGGGVEGGAAKTGASAEDKEFAAYAATHGITALEGGGEAIEVTADGLRLEAAAKERPVKLDGVLNEWPALAKAAVVKGATKSALKIGLQYDEAKLYVGADVTDSSFQVGKDHVQIVLAVPTPGGGYTSYDLGFFAGKPGETEGSVRYGSRGHVAGAKIVEAPEETGYTFEAVIPWSSLPELRATRVGVHGYAAYADGDGVVATGPGDPQHPRDMPWVPSEPELALIEQMLQPKGLTRRAPDAELVADLTGNGTRERVAVWETFLTICGASYLGGTGFFFRDLSGQLVKLEARDVTGRGKADVIVRRKQSVGDAEREYLEVWSAMNATEEPRMTFSHEIAVRQSDHRIDNAVRLARGEIDVMTEPAVRWDSLSYKEPIATDVESILLPWGAVKSQAYRFDGAKFSRVKEVAQREQVPAPAAGAPERSSPPSDLPAEPPTPKVTKGGDLSARVLDQYRKDRGLGDDAAPTVDLKVQVTGDRRPERVVLVGRDIVVFGPGFKGGAGYAFLTLQQFADARDIKDVSARDLTGDGAADLVVRGVRHMSADGGTVDVDVLFVYEVRPDAIARIFGIETAREIGSKRVQGLVQFVPAAGGKSFDILSAPGRAAGWTEKTYPWAQDQPGSGSLEPLLLPWGGIRSVRYTWNGSAFVKS